MIKWLQGLLSRTAPVAAATTPNSADTDANAHLWRRAGSRRNRDLDDIDHLRAVEDSVRSFQRDPLSRRFVRLKTAFVVGSSPPMPSIRSDDEAVQRRGQQIADAWWTDPSVRLNRLAKKWANTLWTTGELCIIAKRGESGFVQTARIDSTEIEEVVTDPFDADCEIGVLRQGYAAGTRWLHPVLGKGGKLPRVLTIARDRAIGELQRERASGRLTREEFREQMRCLVVHIPRGGAHADIRAELREDEPAFYLGLNAIGGQTRGISDIYPVLDHLQNYDDIVYRASQRAVAASAFAWDLAVDRTANMTPEELQKEARTCSAAIGSGSGGVYAHNDFYTLSPMSSNAGASDASAAIQIPMRTILIGFGLPPHWFGDSASTQHTAGETEGPIITVLEQDQHDLRFLLCDLLTYALTSHGSGSMKSHIEAGTVSVDVTLPKLVSKDSVRMSSVLLNEINAIDAMHDRLWISEEAARREAIKAGAEYGFDLNLERDAPTPDEVAMRTPGGGNIFQLVDDAELRQGEDQVTLTRMGDQRGEPTDVELRRPRPTGTDSGGGGVSQPESSITFNELSLAIQRLGPLEDETLVDALREETFRRLGKKKKDRLKLQES